MSMGFKKLILIQHRNQLIPAKSFLCPRLRVHFILCWRLQLPYRAFSFVIITLAYTVITQHKYIPHRKMTATSLEVTVNQAVLYGYHIELKNVEYTNRLSGSKYLLTTTNSVNGILKINWAYVWTPHTTKSLWLYHIYPFIPPWCVLLILFNLLFVRYKTFWLSFESV